MRDKIADIIAAMVSGLAVQDFDIQEAHRRDQLAAADAILALTQLRQPDETVDREGWQPASERPPERTPVLAEYHEWNRPEGIVRHQIVWWCNGCYRTYPSMSDEAYCDRWNADLAAALATPADDGEQRG